MFTVQNLQGDVYRIMEYKYTLVRIAHHPCQGNNSCHVIGMQYLPQAIPTSSPNWTVTGMSTLPTIDMYRHSGNPEPIMSAKGCPRGAFARVRSYIICTGKYVPFIAGPCTEQCHEHTYTRSCGHPKILRACTQNSDALISTATHDHAPYASNGA